VIFGQISADPSYDEAIVAGRGETGRAPLSSPDTAPSFYTLAEAASARSGTGKERFLPVPLPEASPPAMRQRRAARALPIGFLLYLVSIGITATATVSVFFGIGFQLLLQPSGAMIPDAGQRDRVSVIKPLLYGLVPDVFSNGSATDGNAAPPAAEPAIAHTVATAALPPPASLADASADVVKQASPGDRGQQTDAGNPGPADPAPAAALAEAVSGSTVSTPAAAPPGPLGSTVEIAQLVARGDDFLRIGDVTSARLFYERAADSGDGQAAMRMGATFDPGFLGRAGLNSTRGDPAKAQSWYRHALELGAAEADRRSDRRQVK
jgi:hypothetical protein